MHRRDVVVVHVTDDEVAAAAVVLSSDVSAPTLVWDERWGWCTSTSRRHPIERETGRPPEGDGVRYLSRDREPPAPEVLSALYDGWRGTRRRVAGAA